MKKVLTLILITCAMVLSSCHSDDEPVAIRNCVNTVFVYMPWTGSATSSSNSLTSDLRKNILDIKKSIISGNGNTDSTRTIVFFASSATDGRLFEINADTTETTIRNYSEGAMTTTNELTALLNTVAGTTGTRTYSIIVGAHASGWLPAASETYLSSRSFGGTTQALRTDITTLATAITQSAMGKLQYLCFDDCYMANVETAYAFRNVTHWLIASTSEIMAEGLPYSSIWQYLSSPTVDYSKIIAGFDSFYSDNPNYPYGTLSAIDCSKAADMATLMKTLNESTSITGEYDTSNIQALDGYPVHIFYDMGSYLHDYCGDDSVRYKAVFDKLKELVPYHCCTPELITAMFYEAIYSVNTSSGITISDPTTSPYAKDAKTQTEWWQATH